MMAEVIVVAAIILVSLTGFYVLYTRTISLYSDRIDYNDVTTLYDLSNYRNKNSFNFSNSDERYKWLSGFDLDDSDGYDPVSYNVFLFRNLASISNFVEYEEEDINKTFQEYLGYLKDSIQLKYGDSHILVMEKCRKDDDNKYVLDCKYAYLETAVK